MPLASFRLLSAQWTAPTPAAGEDLDLLFVHPYGVGGRQALPQDPERLQVPDRSRPESLPHHGQLARGLGEVNHHRGAETVGQLPRAPEGLGPDGVAGMREEGRPDEGMPLPLREKPLRAA